MQKKQRILVYRHGSIGDTVVALPCFHKIRQTYPQAIIVVLTNRPFSAKEAPLQSILGNDYFFDQVLTYPGATRNPFAILQLLIRLWTLQLDTVIDLTVGRLPNRVVRDRLFFRLAGVRQFIGFPHNDEPLDLKVDPLTGMAEWEAERLTKRISALGAVDLSDSTYWDLRLTGPEIAAATDLLTDLDTYPILAISLGTKAQANDWGLANWRLLLRRLSEPLAGWGLVVLGSADERAIAAACLREWSSAGINLCGRSSARVAAAVLRRAALFVGHDSGPMHLAGCVGTPWVAIFSARNLPGQWFPRGTHNQIIYHKTDCAGCGLVRCVAEGKKCILSITVGEVEEAVLTVATRVQADQRSADHERV